MYKIIPVLAISFFSCKAAGQNNFQGKITYQMSFFPEKENTTIEAFYGNQKIKVLVKQSGSEASNKEDLILDFKNGICYKITNHSKTYTKDSLKKSARDIFTSSKALIPLTERNIILLGYKSSAYRLPYTQSGGYHPEPSTIFWYADSLPYRIPEQYASVEMVPLFTNGSSVGFGMKLVIQREPDKYDSSEFTLVAIEPKTIPDSLLELPAGYSLMTDTFSVDGNQVTEDTMYNSQDTIASPAEPLEQPVKHLDKPGKRNSSPHKNAIKNKSKTPVKKQEN